MTLLHRPLWSCDSYGETKQMAFFFLTVAILFLQEDDMLDVAFDERPIRAGIGKEHVNLNRFN